MNISGFEILKIFFFFSSSNTLEVKLELRWGMLVLFVLVVKLPSLFSITVIVCTLPPGAIHALESASGIPGRFHFKSSLWNQLFFCPSTTSNSRNQTTPILETDKTDRYKTAHLQLYPSYPFPCAVQTSLGRQSGSYQACRHRQRHPS